MEDARNPVPDASGSAPAPYRLGYGASSLLTLGLLGCGGIGALIFTAIYLVEGVTRPGYDALRQPISALSLGPGGWAQQANFIVYGALLVLSAAGWYRFLTPLRGALWFGLWFPVLQGVSSLCLIGAGIFTMDPFPGYPPGTSPGPSTLHGTLHGLFAWTLILSMAMGCFTFATLLRFKHIPQWRGWYAYSVVTGVLLLIFWGAFVDGASGHIAGLAPLAGLAERLSAMIHDLWLFALTATLLIQHRRRSG